MNYYSIGLREIAKYQAVMRAIGGGFTELNQIGQRAGLPTDTGVAPKKRAPIPPHPERDLLWFVVQPPSAIKSSGSWTSATSAPFAI